MPTILALGSGGSGQLGIGRLEEKLAVPTPCLFDTEPAASARPIALAAGGNHSLILFDDGTLYAAGDNTNGCCGHTELGILLKFHRVELPVTGKQDQVGIKAIAATWTASIIVTEHDDIYVFGEGTKGELGLGSDVSIAQVPTRIEGFPPQDLSITQLRASPFHILTVLNDGSLWGWGVSRHHQLGEVASKTKGGFLKSPTKLDISAGDSFVAQSIVCGNGFSYVVGGRVEGDIPSRRGILLGKDKNNIRSDALESLPALATAYATWSSIYVHDTPNFHVRCWGKDKILPLAKAGFPLIAHLVTGSAHAAAKLQDGKVIAWGWNEHQNCGKGPGPAGSYTSNVISRDQNSEILGCGCATTFIVQRDS